MLEYPAKGGGLEKHREHAVERGPCSWRLRDGLPLYSECSNSGRLETVRLKCDMTKQIGYLVGHKTGGERHPPNQDIFARFRHRSGSMIFQDDESTQSTMNEVTKNRQDHAPWQGSFLVQNWESRKKNGVDFAPALGICQAS